ncbi:hypothetical protein Tco_1054006 [Tanacetum coccineum]|uniref:CCHC-type domain-containing protein n=1 Tax=Tanacetum coccineum TaxID=301880 RepID=A0ABQ5GWL0_9ASTR
MASLNYRLNHTFKECASCGAWYTKSCGCSKGGFKEKFVHVPNKTPYSSQRPPKNCPRCGNSVEGPYCRGCALLRKKLKEVWFTYCVENGIFQDLQDTSESSNDNTKIVSAPQEPFVFNQDPGENSSQSPPHIDHHCCYRCGDSLDDIFCQRCTCKSCGNGAHYGYNCPPKVPIISNPEPCNNQTVDELPQTLPSFDPTCYSGDGNSFTYDSTPNFVNDSPNIFNPPPQPQYVPYSCELCGNDAHHEDKRIPEDQAAKDRYWKIPICYVDDDDEESSIPLKDIIIYGLPPCDLNFVDDSPNRPPQPPTYSYEFCGDDAYYGLDYPPQVLFIYNPEPSYNQDFNFPQNFQRKFRRFSFYETPKVISLAWETILKIEHSFEDKQYQPEGILELFHKLHNDVQNIHEELAEYINNSNWNRSIVYYDDDDEDYTIAITPILSTEEPNNSLSMGDEHLDTIPETESDKVIKSSVEDLVLILSESEGIPDSMCDVPFRDNSPPLDISKDQFEGFSNSNDDSTLIDDDSFSIDDIDYVEASPPDSELVSLEVVKIVIPKVGGIDIDILLTIKDDILHEKLLNVNLLISKIEALKDNPIPSSDFVTKSSSTSFNFFLEETNTFDNSLPESETFCFNLEEISSGSPTSYSDLSLPDYEAFFCSEPDSGNFTMDVVEYIFDNPTREPRVHVPNILPTL